MTINLRNSLLILGLFIAILCIFAFPVSVFLLHRADWLNHPLSQLVSHQWWLTYHTASPSSAQYLWYAAVIFANAVFVFVIGVILKAFYRRTASAEVFFFLVFLFTFPFELLKPWNAVLSIHGGSILVNLVLSRIIFFGRFFGWAALFISSLYAIDIRYHKFGILLLIALLLSLTLASSMPVDTSTLLADFLFRLGDETAILFITLISQLLAVTNYFVAAYRRQNRRFILAAVAILLVIVGNHGVTFFGSPVQLMLGFFAGAAGTLLFLRQMNEIYLWA
jgi:hypothetical protein